MKKFNFAVPVALLFFPLFAFAHAHLTSSNPAKNAVLHSAPKEIVLHFSEALELSMCKLQVKDLANGDVVSDGTPVEAGDKSSMKIQLKSLKSAKSTYEVSWKAVAQDAHSMPGKFQFSTDLSQAK
jgi:methionine-rich copper-binding protein CopC